MEPLEELLSAYANEADIMTASYEMMGMMLNSKNVVSKCRERGIEELYIYGGGFLGIQFFRAICDDLRVIAVVDKSGGLIINVPLSVPIIDLPQFEKEYAGQAVVITPVKHFAPIQRDLNQFVPMETTLYLGELLGGIR